MKWNMLLPVGALVVGFAFTGCCGCSNVIGSNSNNKIEASNNIKSKIVNVSNFTSVKLMGNAKIIYTTGGVNVKITAPDNIIDLIETSVENNVLTVKYKDKSNFSFSGNNQPVIYVSSPTLENATLMGSGDIILDSDITANNLSLSLMGSGDIIAKKNIRSSKFDATLSGSGDIKLSDAITTSNAKVTLNGSGDIKATSIIAANLNVTLNGSGDIDINMVASTDLYNALNGSGDLKIQGISTTGISTNLRGSGDIYLEGSAKASILDLKNSGTIDAFNLTSDSAVVTLEGSGSIKCKVSSTLKSKISGSGDVYYIGNPTIEATGKAPEKK